MASELSPQSVNAWSRIGDAFTRRNSTEKALFAYQNVLDIGDKALYASQIANAQLHLADYYQRMDIPTKADDYREQSRKYYQAYGIVNPLTSQEMSSVEIIASQTLPNYYKNNIQI